MAINTYQKLRAVLCSTGNKDDISAAISIFEGVSIESIAAQCIEKATMRINRDLISRGGHKNMEAVTTALTTTAAQQSMALPTDFSGHRTLIINSNPVNVLEFVDPTSLFTQYGNSASGIPQKFTIVGNSTVYFGPVPDANYATTLIYYQSIDPLVNDSDTNWVLDDHWDIYEATAMAELMMIVENDERVQYWNGIYNQKVNDLMGDDRNTRWAGTPTMPSLNVMTA